MMEVQDCAWAEVYLNRLCPFQKGRKVIEALLHLIVNIVGIKGQRRKIAYGIQFPLASRDISSSDMGSKVTITPVISFFLQRIAQSSLGYPPATSARKDIQSSVSLILENSLSKLANVVSDNFPRSLSLFLRR